MKILIFTLSAMLMFSCSFGNSDDADAQKVAETWADAYFNGDFHRAEQYVTKESMKWLNFAASNTTEADLQLLNQKHAEIEVHDYIPVSNDTLRVVTLMVSNYLASTAPNEPPRQIEKGMFQVTVVKRDGSWVIRMEGLPRNEKQSHDSTSDE